ncbi:30S ribosomal protein S16 [Planctomycetota bacterium]
MAVKIRMTRMGRRHRPFFRINAIDSRAPRDGRVLERLGHYDPIEKDADKQVVLKLERIKHWLDLGAIPSETVSEMLAKHGIETKAAKEKAERRAKARVIAKSKGKLFNTAQRIAAQKKIDAEAAAAEAAKKEAEEKAKAKAEAAAAKEAAEKAAAEEATAEETPAEGE